MPYWSINDGLVSAYIDNSHINSVTGGVLQAHGDIALGKVDGKTKFVDKTKKLNGVYYDGLIDDFRIYNRALTEDKISQINLY